MPFVYRTELTDKILSSPQARRILTYITPDYGEDYPMLWLIQAIGSALDMGQEWADDFIKQVFPQTATWSIEKWEKGFRMKPEAWWTLEQRRQAVIARENPNLPMGPERLADIASNAAGVRVGITENTGRNKFEVVFQEDPDRPSRYNLAAYAEIDRYKPSHLIYESGVLLQPVTVFNRSLFLLHSLAVLIRADNFNLIATRFDGWEKFNGARQFGLVEHRRLRLYAVESSFAAENRSGQGVLLKVMVNSSAKYGKGWKTAAILPARNECSVRAAAVDTGAAVRSLNTTKLAVEKDTQWYFDGTYCFDGTRRFNAGIQKEVL